MEMSLEEDSQADFVELIDDEINQVAPSQAIETVTSEVEIDEGENTNKRKRANASSVWDSFKKLPCGTRAVCIYCAATMASPSGNGTSSLKGHIKICKKGPFKDELVDKKQRKLAFIKLEGESGSTLKLAQWTKDGFRRTLARYIVIDELPFRHVEGEGFKEYSAYMNPQFFSVSRTTITKDIWKLYEEDKSVLKNTLRGQRVSITTDCWTSIQNIAYMCVTAHLIDKSWRVQKRIISFVRVEDHTAETLCLELMDCFNEWGITMIQSVTMDNASANDSCIVKLKRKLQDAKSTVFEDGTLLHVRCACHILNIIVGDGLTDLASSISSIRNAVRYVRSSPARSKRFNEFVKKEMIEFKSFLCLDVSTRWNSTYLMLKAALKFRKAFDRMKGDLYYGAHFSNPKVSGPPDDTDWDKAITFVTFLKTFHELTKRLSGTTYATSNLYLTYMCDVKARLDCLDNSDNLVVALMVSKMKKKFDKYWGQPSSINRIVFLGTMLDPRYKSDYLEHCAKFMFDEKAGPGVVEDTKSLLGRIFAAYNGGQNDSRGTSSTRTPVNIVAGDQAGSTLAAYMKKKLRSGPRRNP